MTPGKIAGFTRDLQKPRAWDEAKQGPCGSLPIRDQFVNGNTPEMVSEWVPNEDERRLIAAGAPIQIGVVGNVHPPLWVGVGEAAKKAAGR